MRNDRPDSTLADGAARNPLGFPAPERGVDHLIRGGFNSCKVFFVFFSHLFSCCFSLPKGDGTVQVGGEGCEGFVAGWGRQLCVRSIRHPTTTPLCVYHF